MTDREIIEALEQEVEAEGLLVALLLAGALILLVGEIEGVPSDVGDNQ